MGACSLLPIIFNVAAKNNNLINSELPPPETRPMPVPDQPMENSLVQTLEPYEQPSTSTTHHSSRGRGGGRGRGGAHRSATNNENDEDQGWINPSQQRKNIRQRKKKQRKLRELKLDMNNLNEMNTNTFPKYYSVKFPRKDIDNDIPSVAVDKDIRSNIGKPKSIKKQNKDTLLMEVQSENQGKKVMQIKKLGGLEVQVTEHKALNQRKGALVSRAMTNSTIGELTEARADQKVIYIYI